MAAVVRIVPAAMMELAMEDHKRSFGENLAYRIAARRFESAFEACQQLSESDRQLLLKETAERILHFLPKTPAAKQSAPKVLEPIREVWIHDEAFAASRLSMMRIMARRTKAATVIA